MNRERVHTLAASFSATKCNIAFADLYRELLPEYRRRWNRKGDDPHEGEESYHAALWEIARGWKEEHGDFVRALNIRYKQRGIDRLRKRLRKEDNEYSLDEMSEDSEDKAPTLIEDEGANVYDIVEKKMIDHGLQSVIDHLLHPAKSDYATTRIVAALKVPQLEFESANALAKATGIHHEIVKRRLSALSRQYDANRFGDISDYLAV
jgi:DNA-directed RNA polymerase specialized sigma24 family protein